jgi:DNA-binding CsgD family transcriptional regulator
VYLSDQMENQLVRMAAAGASAATACDIERLSDRELEVFTLLGQGRSTAQIAASMHISGSTVATHREHIIAKLNLENSRDLVRRAVTWIHSQDI